LISIFPSFIPDKTIQSATPGFDDTKY